MWDLPLPAGPGGRDRSGGGIESWELALGYGDARREAEALIGKALAANPADSARVARKGRVAPDGTAQRRRDRRRDEGLQQQSRQILSDPRRLR